MGSEALSGMLPTKQWPQKKCSGRIRRLVLVINLTPQNLDIRHGYVQNGINGFRDAMNAIPNGIAAKHFLCRPFARQGPLNSSNKVQFTLIPLLHILRNVSSKTPALLLQLYPSRFLLCITSFHLLLSYPLPLLFFTLPVINGSGALAFFA